MRAILSGALFLHLAVGVAHAQTFNDLQIELGAYNVKEDGGEKPNGVWYSTGPVAIGKALTATYSFGDTCEAFAVSSDGSLIENATLAWRIELTPRRVVRDAVTFRLRWRMAVLRQGRLSLEFDEALPTPNADIELTLRPGESFPVYTVPVPAGAKTVDGRRCGSSASIRVLVDSYPSEEVERRLVAADLWLIERSNGGETQRGQTVSARGLLNRPFPFYFDGMGEGKASLDVYGILTARLESDDIAMTVETRIRWPLERSYGPEHSVKSVVQLKPSEIVEIRLPKLGPGPFAGREFSIRIRARQVR